MILTKEQVEKNLVNQIPHSLKIVAKVLNENGHDCFLVGGSVRDAFLNKTPHDFDLATDAMPNDVFDILQSNNIKCELRGVEFGVVVAIFNKMEFEIATFRNDISAGTGNLMDDNVKLGVTIEEDVNRRDLTINALFFDINKNKVIDLVNGIDDMQNKIIKTVGDPNKRFTEDSTRKLRSIRFSVQLGFNIDDEIIKSIKQNPELKCNNERVMKELKKIFSIQHNMNKTTELMQSLNILPEVFKDCLINSNLHNHSITSLTTFVANVVDKNTNNKVLSDVVKDTNVINGCKLIWNLSENSSIVDVHRKLKSCDLTKDEIVTFFDNNKFSKFFDPTIPDRIKQLNKKAIDLGLNGLEIGKFTKEHIDK